MGGHNAGEVASRVAVDAVMEFMHDSDDNGPWLFGYDHSVSRIANRLRTAIQLANLQVLEAAGSAAAFSGMGTTVVAAMVSGATLAVAHVGDSRLYVYSRRTRTLRQVTDDDSWVAAALAASPGTDVRLFANHPLRHALTNVLGRSAGTDVHVAELELSGGDVLALTTDGIHGVLDASRIEALLVESSDSSTPDRLVRAAIARGSRDNCTAVVAAYETA
jgi:protein phosphatase